MLVALGSIASAQSKATVMTERAAHQLLDFAATHPDAVVRYTASDMVLRVFTAMLPIRPSPSPAPAPAVCVILAPSLTQQPPRSPRLRQMVPFTSTAKVRVIVASATEAEFAALFFNAQDACMLRTTLAELGHTQPATAIQTDNECAMGALPMTLVKQKRSKAIDKRFYWIRDRVRQNQFKV